MSVRVPLTVVGGYLGAGKTTLINGMLRSANGCRLAILVNEFGALPIDEDLIVARSENLVSIAGGCICCAFGDSLADALAEFARMDTPPDHVLVEASGVAIPSSIAATASLVSGMELHGTVVLADVQTIRARARDRFMGDTIIRQLADADIVVLTRSELVGGDAIEAVTAWVASETGHGNIITSTLRRVPADILLDLGPTSATAPDVGHDDALYDTVVLKPGVPVNVRELARRLVDERLGIIRAKGLIVDAAGHVSELHVVGNRWSVTPARVTSASGLVCIGQKARLCREKIRELLLELEDTAAGLRTAPVAGTARAGPAKT
ncbi:MAG: GTP-binding protein [Alphaproteobacteria bacterium]|nr:GTP-binding protein [Alphaproteobacteria bacterium]